MDTFLSPYVVAAAIGLAGVAFVALAYVANRLLAPRDARTDQMPPPEAAPNAADERWLQVHLRHYIGALVYAAIVSGVVYLFPWATIFALPGFGVPVVVAMAVFAGFLAAGVLYALRRGVLTWR